MSTLFNPTTTTTITFEHGTDVTADALHELLCLAIHEHDPESLATLAQEILDIKIEGTTT